MKEIERTTIPVCLTIAGLDPSGGAGVIADIKTFQRFGCFPAAAVTSITFQNTTAVFGAESQSAATVRSQILPILDDYSIAAIKTGMLPTDEVISAVAEIITERRLANIVVDPVVRSTSGFDLIDDAALRSMIDKLFPLADVITPNRAEAERIVGHTIYSMDDLMDAADKMLEFGPKFVLLKGGHFDSDRDESGNKVAVDHLISKDSRIALAGAYYDTEATHGTGCTLSAAIAANLANSFSMHDATRAAKDFVNEAIRTAPLLGNGNSPINI